jgi:hypothetical protein
MRQIGIQEEDDRPMVEAPILVPGLLRSNPRRVNANILEQIFRRVF